MFPYVDTFKTAIESTRRLLHHPATAWLILVVSFALTAIAWHLSNNYIYQRTWDRFNFQVQDVRTNIIQRMLDYESTLRGGLGLFEASEHIGRTEWRIYAATLQLEHYYPGIQGFGFSQVVMPDELAQHEQAIRAEGFPNYQVKPVGQREIYTAIVYLEPFNLRNQRAFGYDMFSEPIRRTAMERARDTGQPALSGRVTLLQEIATDVQHGVLLYLPLYRHNLPHETIEQRRATLRGFVYAPFRMHDLMHGILGADQGNISFELYDGLQMTSENLLYQTQPGTLYAETRNPDAKFDGVSTIDIAGHHWSLYLYNRPNFLSHTEENQPLMVAVGGILVDLLLFFIIGSISRQQHLAEALARGMTVDLRRSNADLEQFAYAASHDMRQPLRMISSYLQLLEQDLDVLLDDETRHNLHYAIEGARRLDQMLVALLNYSRVGRKTDTKSYIDSREVLNESLHILEPSIKECHAEIHIEGKWPILFASRDEILRLLQNLIDNAIKYRIKGCSPKIILTAEKSNNEYRFSVRDNGIGLRSGQETRLFKVFERLQSREKYPGTGIGLALCRKIIEHHDGRIWVESEGENQGCSFIFVLPGPTEKI